MPHRPIRARRPANRGSARKGANTGSTAIYIFAVRPYREDVFLSNGSTFVTGWTHRGNTNGEFYTFSGQWGINAGEGTYYIGWGGSSVTDGTLAQTFDTLIGTTYNINYLLTTQQSAPAGLPQVAFVQALDGSTVLNSVTNSFNQAAGWWNNGLTLSSTATSSSTTLRFTDQTTLPNSASANWALDGVTVAASGVPEPATCPDGTGTRSACHLP